MRHLERVRKQYRTRDSVKLLETIQSIAEEIGLDAALALLEQCVTEKRVAWIEQHLQAIGRTGDPLMDGYRAFYEHYLGLSAENGEIVEVTASRLVSRWWNPCPTLEACQHLGMDTRTVCKRAYHGPVDAFLSRIDPRLRFERDYAAIRPHAPYCQEIILLAPRQRSVNLLCEEPDEP
jgi:hypothetical protein